MAASVPHNASWRESRGEEDVDVPGRVTWRLNEQALAELSKQARACDSDPRLDLENLDYQDGSGEDTPGCVLKGGGSGGI